MRERLDELLNMIPPGEDLVELEAHILQDVADPLRHQALRRLFRAIRLHRVESLPVHLRPNPGSNRAFVD